MMPGIFPGRILRNVPIWWQKPDGFHGLGKDAHEFGKRGTISLDEVPPALGATMGEIRQKLDVALGSFVHPGSAPSPVPQNAWDEAVGVDAMHDQGSCLMAISPLRSFGPIPAETEVAPSTVTPFLQTP